MKARTPHAGDSPSSLALSGTMAVLTFVSTTLAGGCFGDAGVHRADRFENSHVGYDVKPPGEGWIEVKLDGADITWHNPKLAAGLLVNSHCEGVQDSPLEGLTGELLMGTTEREILEQTRGPASGREALETVATVKLDGVPRKRMLWVLKKDGCVYDIVYDAAPESFDDGVAAYRRVRDSVIVGPRHDRG